MAAMFAMPGERSVVAFAFAHDFDFDLFAKLTRTARCTLRARVCIRLEYLSFLAQLKLHTSTQTLHTRD